MQKMLSTMRLQLIRLKRLLIYIDLLHKVVNYALGLALMLQRLFMSIATRAYGTAGLITFAVFLLCQCKH